MPELYCVELGTASVRESIFQVDVANNETVDILKRSIWEKRKYNIPYSKIELYLACKEDVWLSQKDPDLQSNLDDEEGSKDVFKNKLESFVNKSSWMNRVEEWNFYFRNNPPPQRCIHVVVVVVVPAEENAAKKSRIEEEVVKPHRETPIVLDLYQIKDIDEITTGSFYRITGLKNAGLGRFAENIFYCRKDTTKLIKALNVMKKGIRISGPSGVGKSTTVWLWVCNQVRKRRQSVLWIHVGIIFRKYLRIRPSGASAVTIGVGELQDYIQQATDDIVVLDGVISMYEHLEFALFNPTNKLNRIALSVWSVAVTSNDEVLIENTISTFKAEPWSLGEYYEAVKDDAFFDRVRKFLLPDTADDDDETFGVDDTDHFDNADNTYYTKNSDNDSFTREDLVEHKYFYAGCSARWMFGWKRTFVIQLIKNHVNEVQDFPKLLNGDVGIEHEWVANKITNEVGDSGERFFVSQYAYKRAVDVKGDNVYYASYALAIKFENPSLLGWIMEHDFIKRMKGARGNMLKLESFDNVNIKENFEVKECVSCDTDLEDEIKKIAAKFGNPEELNNVWFLPTKWNQGGYDLVSLQVRKNERSGSTTKILRYIQVTRAHNHKLKLQHFRRFVVNFRNATGLVIRDIVIFVVVPIELHAKPAIGGVHGNINDLNIGETNIKSAPFNASHNVKFVRFAPRK